MKAAARRRLGSTLFVAVTAATAAAVAAAYPGTDGGGWIGPRMAQLKLFQALFLAAGLAAILGGAAGALLSGGRRARPVVAGAAALVGAFLLARGTGLPVRLEAWLEAPDWLRLTLFVEVGACWGLGWGCARAAAGIAPPLWSLGLPFLAGGVAVTAFSGSVGAAVSLAWLLVVPAALGHSLWQRLGRRGAVPGPPPPAAAFALGIAALGLLARLIGLVHLAHPAFVLAVLVALPLLLRRGAWSIVEAAIRRTRAAVRLPPAAALLAGTLGALLLAQWIASVAPEVGGDSTGGRVALPAIWLRDGFIGAKREIVLSYMSIGAESFFMLLMPLAGYVVAKVAAFACLLVIIGTVAGRSCRWGNAWALGAAVAFAASTIVWWQFIWGFCDLLQVALLLGCAASLQRWCRRGDDRLLVAAGLLAGASASIKLNGVLFMVAAASLPLAVLLRRGRGVVPAIVASLKAAVPAILMVAPALVRSAYLTGNPVFPFANSLFRSPLAPPTLVTNHFGLPLGQCWRDVTMVFLEPQKFSEIGTYHPLLLALVAGCAAALFAATSAAWFWFGAFLLSGAFWLLTEQNLRYSLFVGLFAALAVARTAAALRARRGALLGWAPSLAMALAVGAGITLQVARPSFWLAAGCEYQALPLRWAIGRESTDTFLRRNQSTYALAQVLNRETGKATRVWQMPWVRDHLYFNCQVVSLPHGDIRLLDPLTRTLPGQGPAMEPARIAAVLRKAGITHLIVDTTYAWVQDFPESSWTHIYAPAFIGPWLEPVAANGYLRLYRLRDAPRDRPAPAVELARVSAKPGMTELPVAAGRLYDFYAPTLPRASGGPATIYFLWLDKGGSLLLFQGNSIPTAREAGWHHCLQSAPPGAARLRVQLISADPAYSIVVRRLSPDRGDP